MYEFLVESVITGLFSPLIVICYKAQPLWVILCHLPVKATHLLLLVITVLGFSDTSTLVGHFVSSPRERGKRNIIVEKMNQRDREERGTGMQVKKQKK